jgi:cytidylate kinase
MADRVIAIDGPAGSGKSTTAKAVARELGLAHLDSGALYRSLTLASQKENLPADGNLVEWARQAPIELRLSDSGYVPTIGSEDVSEEIRSERVTGGVSGVASVGEVRDWVNWALGRAASLHPRGVVVDGRDIGTVVFPEAVLKVFLVASPRARASRRVQDMGLEPSEATLRRIEAEIESRDQADSSRDIAPLRKAEDAVEIDTTDLDFPEQVARVAALARSALLSLTP